MKNMITMAVYFDVPDAHGYPFDKADYFEAYAELTQYLAERSIDLVIVRSMQSYEGGGKFERSWKIIDGELIENGPVTVKLVYDKGANRTSAITDIKLINCDEIEDICSDKRVTQEKFPDISPKSFYSDRDSVEKVREAFSGEEKIVVKPLDGFGGEGVVITDVDSACEIYKQSDQTMLAQQFIDTSKGITGITDGMHDLRAVVINGYTALCYLRIPAEGSLISNYSLGGTIRYVSSEKLPDAALELIARIDNELSEFGHRVYSIDMAFEGDRAYLIELNARPGINSTTRGKEAIPYMDALSNLLALAATELE